MKVKIKKLHPDAVIPTYATQGDAGMDLTAIAMTQTTHYEGFVEFRTGLSIEIPEGYVGLIFPRSSISKTALHLANSVGVIDSGYRGEITARFKVDSASLLADVGISQCSTPEEKKVFESYTPTFYGVGDKIAQLIILPYPQIQFEEVEELSTTERGEGGFGSTDKLEFFPIWVEGHITNGSHITASFVGMSMGKNFKDAVIKKLTSRHAKEDLEKHFDIENLTWSGSRFFNNEADARKSFG